MITLKPFKAIRPTRDKASLVGSRSYLSYTDQELDDKLENNPYTFLHIINPKGGRHLGYSFEKYSMVRDEFLRFYEEGIFVQDEEENFYIYRQVKEGNEYIGLIAAVAVKDYLSGKICKHENTLTEREKMFGDYLETTGFNAEPVLLTYQDDLRLNKLFAKYVEGRSDYEFTSTDRVMHQLWPIDDREDCALVSEIFNEQETLYIADGHHRCASSAVLSQRLHEQGKGDGPHDFFMAFLIGEEQMKVYDFNRLVKGLNGMKSREFLDKLKADWLVEPLAETPFRPEKIHEVSMYLEGRWYKLMAKTGTYDPRDPVGHLDADILSKNLLTPILGIENIKTDTRVGFLPGTEGMKGLKKKVDEGSFDVAFGLCPVTIDQIKDVANAGATMPPKSTYIEPKMRSGLTIYPIDETLLKQ